MKNAIPVGLNIWYVLGLVFESDTAFILEFKAKISKSPKLVIVILLVLQIGNSQRCCFLSGMGYVS